MLEIFSLGVLFGEPERMISSVDFEVRFDFGEFLTIEIFAAVVIEVIFSEFEESWFFESIVEAEFVGCVLAAEILMGAASTTLCELIDSGSS